MSDDSQNHKIRGYFKNIFNKHNEDIRETIEDLIEEAAGEGEDSFSEHEQLLLNNLLYIKEVKVCRIMIPRSEIIAFHKNGTVDELAKMMVDRGHSRIPIYGDSLDDIHGFLHVIDLTKELLKGHDKKIISELEFNKVKMVSPDVLVLDVLKEMQQEKIHMAAVVDDYGGLCGLITIEDLLEEIVGDIEDEYDLEEDHAINCQDNGHFTADARACLEEVEEITGIKFYDDEDEEDEREVDTLGGYVFDIAQRIPNQGEIIEGINGVKFKIVDVDPNKIKKIMIIPPNEKNENACNKEAK